MNLALSAATITSQGRIIVAPTPTLAPLAEALNVGIPNEVIQPARLGRIDGAFGYFGPHGFAQRFQRSNHIAITSNQTRGKGGKRKERIPPNYSMV